MRHTKTLMSGCLMSLAACTPFVLAPGAAEVRVTNLPADAVGCAPVGNIRVQKDANGLVDISRAGGQLKNQTVGLGGNLAFITEGSPGMPMAGVAYNCPARSPAGI